MTNNSLKKLKELIDEEEEDSIKSVNKWYNHGISYIEKSLGIELTILEKAAFREIVKDSLSRHKQIKNYWAQFSLGHEAIEIFLHNYYDVPYMSEKTFDLWIGRKEFIKQNNYDGYSEFWKRRQEETHLI